MKTLLRENRGILIIASALTLWYLFALGLPFRFGLDDKVEAATSPEAQALVGTWECTDPSMSRYLALREDGGGNWGGYEPDSGIPMSWRVRGGDRLDVTFYGEEGEHGSYQPRRYTKNRNGTVLQMETDHYLASCREFRKIAEQPVPSEPRWSVAQGAGRVQQWAVDDGCNLIRITGIDGRHTIHRLPQYEFASEANFLLSLLPVGNRLFVTHRHGAYLVDPQGQVTPMMALEKPTQATVGVRGEARPSQFLPPKPGGWLVAKGWNRKTILATYKDEADPRVLLIEPGLSTVHAFRFTASPFRSGTATEDGWRIEVGNAVYRLTNEGLVKRDRLPVHREKIVQARGL
ncbi:hypothetical protein EON79_16665 [bacterium]|nr:MAG: hypothetical protein EON79_16665 [bacterium]